MHRLMIMELKILIIMTANINIEEYANPSKNVTTFRILLTHAKTHSPNYEEKYKQSAGFRKLLVYIYE